MFVVAAALLGASQGLLWRFWWAGILALAMLLELRRRGGNRVVYPWAFCWLVASLSWLRVLGLDALLLATAITALPWLVVLLVPLKPGVLAWISAVVVAEWLRSVAPLGGFPWALLAQSQVDGPLAPLARLGGQWLLGGVVAGASWGLWQLWLRRWQGFAPVVAIGLLLLLVRPAPVPTGQMTVSAVQGGVPAIGLAQSQQRAAVLQNHLQTTTAYADQIRGSQLVIWPENSAEVDVLADPSAAAAITQMTRTISAPILLGALFRDDVGLRNGALLWSPTSGPIDQYVKRHLVPVGEYVPFRSVLAPLIGRLDLVPVDYQAGTGAPFVKLGNLLIGNAMCFEIAFDSQVREAVQSGAQFLVVQTNNSTYTNTAQPQQQLQISRLRAIESGRDIVIAAANGITAFIDENGNVMKESKTTDSEVLTGAVGLSSGHTPAMGFVSWLPAFAWLFLLGRRIKVF